NTHQPYHHHDYQRDDCVGGHGTDPGTPIGDQPNRQPMLHDEKVSRAQAKHDDGVPIETVTHTPPPPGFQIFRDGHGSNITNATAFEMTRTRMMDGMATPPRMVGCQREHADRSTNPIIRH